MKANLLGLVLCACCACANGKSTASSSALASSCKASDMVYVAPPSEAARTEAKAPQAPRALDAAHALGATDPRDTDQRDHASDLRLAKDVRRALNEASMLSTEAENVTAVARDGVVTLNGVVASAGEKARVEASVTELPGVLRLDDQITIKPK